MIPGAIKPSIRQAIRNAAEDTYDVGRDFVRNVYWPNRRKHTLYFLLNFYAMERITVRPALRMLREGEQPPFQLERGFTLTLNGVIRVRSGHYTDYSAVLKGKDENDVLVWRRSNDRVHFEFVDGEALEDVETGGSRGIVIRFGTI